MPIALATALAAIGGVTIIVAILAGLVRFAIPLWGAKLTESELDGIRAALRGAITLADPVVKLTPTNIDNAFLDGVVKVALAEFERVRGRKPTRVDDQTIRDTAKGMIITRASKSLASQSGAPVGVSAVK
jgi:hypothetical protein